jgi:hypothetical protein
MEKNKTSFFIELQTISHSMPTCQSSPSMLEDALDNVAESEPSTPERVKL